MPRYPSQIPVLIVGAGPTGLTTGLLLARYGVESLIVERNAAPMDIPRAIVLDDEGARTMQIFGGDAAIVSGALTGDGAAYIDDDGNLIARVGAGPEPYGFPKRMFINQPDMETALRDRIARTDGVTLCFSSEVIATDQNEEGVSVIIKGDDGSVHRIRARYVVAADGGRSPIRERLGLKMQGSTYAQDWLVVDTLNDPDTSNYSRFFCSNARPHVRVPAPNGGKRYEFMLLPGETHEQVLDDGFVGELLKPFRVLEDKDLIRKTIYTFHARIVEKWRVGRILLAGDAAHLTPPFAGQGMNAGLRDAANLSWKLACILHGGASDALLDSYEKERRDPAWAMIQLAVVMGDIVMPIDEKQLAFRDQLMASLKPFPAVQDYLLKMKFKPRPRYDAGAFLGLGEQPFEGSIVGEMVSQPKVTLDGSQHRLDDLLGEGFALVAQDAAGAQALARLDQRVLAGLPLAKVYMPYGKVSESFPAAVNTDEHARPYRAHRDQILLVRPDRYCAAAFETEALAQGLADYSALMS